MKTSKALCVLLVSGIHVALSVDGNESSTTLVDSSVWMYLFGVLSAVTVILIGRILISFKCLPTVRISQKIFTAVIGEQVKLKCVISPTPWMTAVSWQRISSTGKLKPLNIDQTKYTGSTPNDPHLGISDINKDDEGEYVCTVSNLYGRKQRARTKLKVTGGPPFLNMNWTEHVNTEGEAAILKCYIHVKPPVSAITWFKKEQGSEREIKIDDYRYFGGNVESPALVIGNPEKPIDEGRYICEADNIAGSGSNAVVLKLNSKRANTERSADPATPNQDTSEAIREAIKKRHLKMVQDLSEHIYPKSACWNLFRELLSAYLHSEDLEDENIYNYVKKLMDNEIIRYGEYEKLRLIVFEIHRLSSRLIEKAESDIKAMKNGGRANETIVIVKSKFKGDFEEQMPESCTSQIKEQYLEIKDRMTEGGSGSIYLNFTISEAVTPDQLSALYLAETLKTRLENRQIVLKDGSGVPLVLKTSPRVVLPKEILKDLPKIRLSRGHFNFTEGKVGILKCVLVAEAETKFTQWFRVKDGKFNAICIDNEKYFGGSPKSPSLTIADVNSSDRGIYVCRARNSAGEEESDIAFVDISCTYEVSPIDVSAVKVDVTSVEEDASTVKMELGADTLTDNRGPPKLIMESQVYTGFGDVAVLKCAVTSNPPEMKVTWTKGVGETEQVIATDNKKYHGGLVKSPSLVIDDVEILDEDVYTCKVENTAGRCSETTYLTVQSKPPSSNLSPYKPSPEELVREGIVFEHAKMLNTLSRYLFPASNDWSAFKESIAKVLPSADLGYDIYTIVESLMKEGCIKYGQYQTLHDAVNTIDKRLSLVIKKAEFQIRAIKKGGQHERDFERVVLEHEKMVSELSKRISPTKGNLDNFKLFLGGIDDPTDIPGNLQDIITNLLIKGRIGPGQYGTLYDAVCMVNKEASLIVKKTEANIRAIRGPDDGSAMEEDISLMKKDIGAIKKDINTIKQDIAVIRQIGSVVKTVSTTEENTNSNIIDEVRPMDVGAVKVDVTSMKEVVSTVKMELGVDTLTDNRDKVSPIDVSEVKVDSTSVKEDASTVKMELGADTLTDNRAKRTRKIQEMIDTTKLTVRIVLSQSEIITTQALEDAKEVIRNNSMVLIKGAPGDGKTILCYQLLKWLMDGDNENTELSKDPLLLYKMSQWDDFVKPEAQIAVFIDDARGDIVEELERRKDSIQSAFCGKMNSRSNCLIVNVRNDIYNSKQMPSCDLFNVKNIVDLRGKSIMTSKEKLQILEKYVPNIEELSGGKKSEIVKLAPNFGFPQCCRLYRDVPSFQNEGIDFFKKPFDFM